VAVREKRKKKMGGIGAVLSELCPNGCGSSGLVAVWQCGWQSGSVAVWMAGWLGGNGSGGSYTTSSFAGIIFVFQPFFNHFLTIFQPFFTIF
jgi:hypothetical protein